MFADWTRNDHHITRLTLCGAECDRTFDHANSGCVDITAVAFSFLHHLGVAGYDLNSTRYGRGLHRRDNFSEIGDRESFFKDKPGGKVERSRTTHRQIIHSSVNGQVADIPARKKERRYHKRVSRERKPRAAQVERRLIFHLFENRIAERLDEQRVHQRMRRFSTGTVRQRYSLVSETRPFAPREFDPLQHLALRDIERRIAARFD